MGQGPPAKPGIASSGGRSTAAIGLATPSTIGDLKLGAGTESTLQHCSEAFVGVELGHGKGGISELVGEQQCGLVTGFRACVNAGAAQHQPAGRTSGNPATRARSLMEKQVTSLIRYEEPTGSGPRGF